MGLAALTTVIFRAALNGSQICIMQSDLTSSITKGDVGFFEKSECLHFEGHHITLVV